jgi:hypothetical protein
MGPEAFESALNHAPWVSRRPREVYSYPEVSPVILYWKQKDSPKTYGTCMVLADQLKVFKAIQEILPCRQKNYCTS